MNEIRRPVPPTPPTTPVDGTQPAQTQRQHAAIPAQNAPIDFVLDNVPPRIDGGLLGLHQYLCRWIDARTQARAERFTSYQIEND